ncbi:MAG: aldo/keto reductase [Pseudomonadales bacterium]|jgi:aryl-alcohol dehydrogenase-like predicted oxidoreductase|nr:aldo/keto reductase [Pseudomonadales bacterium]MDP7144053.1 aldo/keto reductase [Pseudomonadales bacterium]MDP7595540.1 aldo/keto reductase [Pseudomonadales bacterium]HJN50907.1 aldo/keto reductase [Pseudomonadales bacterium]|tara:strand:+ start:2657 stop:3448 length:792 start_codon:yes stop_codon:yes gene_type:complete
MHNRPISDTGVHVSPVGLGTVKFGRNTHVKYPQKFQIPNDRSLANLLATARELGINLLDTAPSYGTSEARLGQLLKQERREWVISSKVGEQYLDGVSRFSFGGDAVRKSVETSLAMLATDYIDIVLVHSDGNERHIIRELDTLDALSRLKDRGTIRCFGVSSKSVEGGLLALEHSDLVMVTYNLNYTAEETVLNQALATNKGVFIKKALASGALSQAENREGALEDALSFACKHPAVTSVIVGTIDGNHLRENVAIVDRNMNP